MATMFKQAVNIAFTFEHARTCPATCQQKKKGGGKASNVKRM